MSSFLLAKKLFYRRLDAIIWTHLPNESKEEHGWSQPPSFADNRLKIMGALEQAGWPIKERDIVLLENEIKQGESYIQQVQFNFIEPTCASCPVGSYVSEARIFGKHALGNQGKSSEHGGNSLLDKFGRVYIF